MTYGEFLVNLEKAMNLKKETEEKTGENKDIFEYYQLMEEAERIKDECEQLKKESEKVDKKIKIAIGSALVGVGILTMGVVSAIRNK